jgi:hypothetical protein
MYIVHKRRPWPVSDLYTPFIDNIRTSGFNSNSNGSNDDDDDEQQ